MHNILDAFAAEAKRKRIAAGYTQRKLAEKLNMSVRTIMDLENCISNPKSETILLIARELNISIDNGYNGQTALSAFFCSFALGGKVHSRFSRRLCAPYRIFRQRCRVLSRGRAGTGRHLTSRPSWLLQWLFSVYCRRIFLCVVATGRMTLFKNLQEFFVFSIFFVIIHL